MHNITYGILITKTNFKIIDSLYLLVFVQGNGPDWTYFNGSFSERQLLCYAIGSKKDYI